MTFADIFALVVGIEGGYTDDPRDPGNWTGGAVGSGTLRGTKYGISAASFPTLDIANLTIEQALAIYSGKYWQPVAGDALPPSIALVVFDCAVNQGLGAAKTILQSALGVIADGVIGPKTIEAARSRNDQLAVIVEIAARRAVRYAQGNMATYGLGWMRRLFTVAGEAITQKG